MSGYLVHDGDASVKDQLYLVRPGFHNSGAGPLYCGDSLPVERMLSFFPQLRTLLDVHYMDFPRPRAALVDLIGEDNQGLPVLILADGRQIQDGRNHTQSRAGKRFLCDEGGIRRYLSSQYGMPEAS